ncbi:MAG: GPR endopeptidase [Clostridia bacterium]|nr:GPR endopeptidase [Clostridia bacterium]
MERSVFYDLACESSVKKESEEKSIKFWESASGNLQIRWGEDEHHGRYAVFFTNPLYWMEDDYFLTVRDKVSEEIVNLFKEYMPKQKERSLELLVIGLGNPKMTADALGAEVVERVMVTRKLYEPSECFLAMSVSAISIGVLGTTGIETLEHLRALCHQIRPDLVLTVDALAAKRSERLGATIQISSGGISPGSGVKQPQKRLSRQTLGVPVVSIGVPTVIHASAILRESFEKLGILEWESAREIVAREGDFFVMPKESDLLLRESANLLSSAINRACVRFSEERT